MKNKINYIILIVTLISTVTFFMPKNILATDTATNNNTSKIGDLNNNGNLDNGDILLMLRHMSAISEDTDSEWILSEEKIKQADVNKNNQIDIGDVLIVLRYIATTSDEKTAKKYPDWLKLEQEEQKKSVKQTATQPNSYAKKDSILNCNEGMFEEENEEQSQDIKLRDLKDIYDIVLFIGQSNMVGRATNTREKRYNHNSYIYDGAKSVKQYSNLTGINKNILNNNGNTFDFVSIKQIEGTAYEYMYLTNSFKEIDSTKKVRYGENLVYKNGKLMDYSETDKTYYSIVKSKGTNMIPQFCQTYYELTGHKVIVVFAAQGGVPIQTMLPHKDIRNNSRKSESYMYEAIKTKYKAAEKLAKEQKLQIANKLYVIAQGETNVELNTSKSEYKEAYMTIHKKLKKELGIEKGAIVETSYTTGYKTMKEINIIHKAQKELIKENKDIYLGSSYFYDRFVPMEKDYKNCNTKVTIDENGDKLSYKEALKRSRYSVDPTIIDKTTEKRNYIHFTSAALSQAGMDVAKNLSKVINNNE